jgi:hypothetical protein
MRSRAHTVAAWAALVAALGGPCVDADGAPRASGHAACEPLRSAARHTRLSQLLRELAAVHSFHLENWSHEDPVVVVAGGSDVELMEALSGQVNLMTRYAAAKDCPGQWRIETIWILPGLPQASNQRLPAAGTPVAPPPPVQSAAKAAVAKRAMDMYLHAHGLGKAEPAASPGSAAASGAPDASSPP